MNEGMDEVTYLTPTTEKYNGFLPLNLSISVIIFYPLLTLFKIPSSQENLPSITKMFSHIALKFRMTES
jgi:hypothetical protein